MTIINTLDLAQVRKIVNQRYLRAKHPELRMLGERTSNAMKICRDDPTLDNASKFLLLEAEYLAHPATPLNTKAYGDEVYDAILCGTFKSTMPKLNKQGLNGSHADPKTGLIYIASCADRPNQLKIGYTTQTTAKRFDQHARRYNEQLTEFYSIEVPYPARLEREIERLLKDFRHAITQTGESNEWYTCTREIAVKALRLGLSSNYF